MSSNRFNGHKSYQARGGGGGGSSSSSGRPHQKFVPKRDVQTSQTVSNPIRQQSTISGGAASSGGGESTSSGGFVDYLPQDEAVAAGLGAEEGGLDPVESQRVVDLLNRELSRLLKLNPRDFWREVASNSSLYSFLESFLKFRSRWYDFPYHGAKGIVAGVIVGEFEISRRVFMVLYRISSNRDPGAKAADSLSPKDYSALLQEKKLLNLPKLLEISAIYGHENEDLTRTLVTNAIKAQPWIYNDLTAAISNFLNIFQTMYQRCTSSLEVLFSSVNPKDLRPSRLFGDYLEVMDFINDAVVSMDAFANAYKQSAVYFSSPVETSHGNEEMLTTLARLHDSLLPSLRQAFHMIFASTNNGSSSDTSKTTPTNVFLSLKMLSTRIVNFGWRLLYSCYLSDEVFDESYPVPAGMKMFPANVEDPVIRTDILVQLVRDINEVSSSSPEEHTRGTFLQSIEDDHKMMSRIELLRNAGWFSVEDNQLQFLSGIVVKPLQANNTTPSVPPSVINNIVQTEEDTAIIESRISQIKDLFPEYGKGFLTACLEVYNQDPEEVIQRILEGTLHKDLQSLDFSMEETPKPKSVAPSTANDKGKGKLLESEPVPLKTIQPAASRHQSGGSSTSSSSAVASSNSSASAVLSSNSSTPAVASSNSSTSAVGRFVRKTDKDIPNSSILDSRSEKDMARTAEFVSQLEYEDEYDDSFDDLGMSIGDSGWEETESTEEKSFEPAVSSNSKWNSRKKPQFYVKDGKNYSYKVAGSVAVSNHNEAAIVNQAQRELIHGLGRGGNLPLGAVKKITESYADLSIDSSDDVSGRGGSSRGGGRRGHGFGRGYVASNAAQRPTESSAEREGESEASEGGGRGNFRGRGRRGGGGGGGRSNYRKDRAMKKHMSSVTGR